VRWELFYDEYGSVIDAWLVKQSRRNAIDRIWDIYCS
jgi:hypothetical protein